MKNHHFHFKNHHFNYFKGPLKLFNSDTGDRCYRLGFVQHCKNGIRLTQVTDQQMFNHTRTNYHRNTETARQRASADRNRNDKRASTEKGYIDTLYGHMQRAAHCFLNPSESGQLVSCWSPCAIANVLHFCMGPFQIEWIRPNGATK